MRIVDKIANMFKSTRKSDPVFGSMLYMGGRSGYWEGKALFRPTGTMIEVFVDGSAEDDMQTQHEFFEQVQESWQALRDSINGRLSEEWVKYNPESRGSPWDHLRIASLKIPNAQFKLADWEISLEETSEAEQLWSVQMRGMQTLSVTVDD